MNANEDDDGWAVGPASEYVLLLTRLLFTN
jgi:hypothetical protein